MTKTEREQLSKKIQGYEAALQLLHSGLFQGQYVNQLGLAVSTLHTELQRMKKILESEVERLQTILNEKEVIDGISEAVSAAGA